MQTIVALCILGFLGVTCISEASEQNVTVTPGSDEYLKFTTTMAGEDHTLNINKSTNPPGPDINSSTIKPDEGRGQWAVFGDKTPSLHVYKITDAQLTDPLWVHIDGTFVTTGGPGVGGNAPEFDVNVVEVEIDTPASFPVFVNKNSTLSLGSTVNPAEATGGTYSWTKVSGPGNVTFSPSATAEDPTFSADTLGIYTVKVQYTKGGITHDDTSGNIIIYQLEFEEDTTTHASIEGYDPNEEQVCGCIPEFGNKSSNSSFTDTTSYLYFRMYSYGENFVDTYGEGSRLQPSGEIRYDVYINVGTGVTCTVKVEGDWAGTGSLSPESTDMLNGGTSIIHLGFSSGTYTLLWDGDTKSEIRNGPDPVVYNGEVSGKQKIGWTEAGVAYHDMGAALGDVSTIMSVTYSVTPP